jgi:hypothetical protein
MTSAEDATAIGQAIHAGSTDKSRQGISDAGKRPRILVVRADVRQWNAYCEKCGPVLQAVEKDVIVAAAHRHNSIGHGDGGSVRVL